MDAAGSDCGSKDASPQASMKRKRCDSLPSGRRLSRLATIIGVLQAVVVAVILLCCVVFSLAWVGGWYDDNCYHIPAAVRIATTMNPYYVDSPVDSHWFPAGAESLVALFVATAGSLNVTNLSGSLCFLLLGILVYRLTGLWSREWHVRLAAVGLAATVPILTGQCLAFYVDIHMALLFVLAVYLCCRSLVTRHAGDAYWALVAMALLPSIKYTGLVFTAILTPAILFCLWCARPPRFPRRGVVIVLCVAVAFTSGWYLRNWSAHGNPVYPFALPNWTHAVFEWAGPEYVSHTHRMTTPTTSWPHPLVPARWLQHTFKPDMTSDAFGLSFSISLVFCAASLFGLHRLDPARRRAWLLVVVVCVVAWIVTPLGRRVPRYMLFVPLLAACGVAVVARALGRETAARGMVAACLGILCFTGAYTYANVIRVPAGNNSIRAALAHLWPYRPRSIISYDYVARGGLRIGYTSGAGNFIARLYDVGLTNELVALHYRDQMHNHGREFESPEAFLEHVRAMQLDYIHIFDSTYPGAELLCANFPEKVRGVPLAMVMEKADSPPRAQGAQRGE